MFVASSVNINVTINDTKKYNNEEAYKFFPALYSPEILFPDSILFAKNVNITTWKTQNDCLS